LEAAEDEITELKTKMKKSNEEHREKFRKMNEEYRQKMNVEKEDKSHSIMSPPRPTPRERNKIG
jgi:hypothetical protein